MRLAGDKGVSRSRSDLVVVLVAFVYKVARKSKSKQEETGHSQGRWDVLAYMC